MQIEQHIIDEIVGRADIVEVIGKHLKLKRSGHNYFACCPFHNEKSPSFSINATKQFFHCFGCGESGNVIGFVMKYSGLSFIDAIKSLASTYGVTLPTNDSYRPRESAVEIARKKQHVSSLNDTINKVVQYYQNSLTNSELATHYLSNRGLNKDMLDLFQIGYASNQASPLANLFSDYANNQFLRDAGLTLQNSTGKIYDRFRDRIMFPIKNVQGKVIAFGGRIIAHGEPKYLNSPETSIFNKSYELYALYESAKQIRSKNQAIMVEGYMDAITMHQFGFNNTVASMGTAVTDEQIKKLFRLCDEITFCFDGDNAGRKAAWRALEHTIPLITDTKTVNFVFLPRDDDPDSFLRKHGSNGFSTYTHNHSLTLSSFLMEQLVASVNIATDEGRAKLISLAKPYIEQLKAVALQVMIKQQLARLSGLEPTVLESILNNRSRYAFYASAWKNTNRNTYTNKNNRIPMLNNIELIIHNAFKHIDWVTQYKFPEQIDSYSHEVQELIVLLDFIGNNCDDNPTINLDLIAANINLYSLDLSKILHNPHALMLTQDEFNKMLDRILGLNTNKAIKIPRIQMK